MAEKRKPFPFPSRGRRAMTAEGLRMVETIRQALKFRAASRRLENRMDEEFENMVGVARDIERIEAERKLVQALLGKSFEDTTVHGLLVIADRIRLMNYYRELRANPVYRHKANQQIIQIVCEDSARLAPLVGPVAIRTFEGWLKKCDSRDEGGTPLGIMALLGSGGRKKK